MPMSWQWLEIMILFIGFTWSMNVDKNQLVIGKMLIQKQLMKFCYVYTTLKNVF
uniref:Candidate secreted effector n=1 Tax=Meloidogyne incognita TaxID=6306 RepID=A0A914LUR9_MELIC